MTHLLNTHPPQKHYHENRTSFTATVTSLQYVSEKEGKPLDKPFWTMQAAMLFGEVNGEYEKHLNVSFRIAAIESTLVLIRSVQDACNDPSCVVKLTGLASDVRYRGPLIGFAGTLLFINSLDVNEQSILSKRKVEQPAPEAIESTPGINTLYLSQLIISWLGVVCCAAAIHLTLLLIVIGCGALWWATVIYHLGHSQPSQAVKSIKAV